MNADRGKPASSLAPNRRLDVLPDLFGPLGLDLDGSCPSCGAPLDADRRGGYCEECE